MIRAVTVVACTGLVVHGCAAEPKRLGSHVSSTGMPSGVVRATATELVLDMSGSCVKRTMVFREARPTTIETPVPCSADIHRAGGTMNVITPWGRRLPIHLAGTQGVIRVDWREAGDDPFDPRVAARLGGAWSFVTGRQTRTWFPSGYEVNLMLAALGDATDTQVTVRSGGTPPDLVVTGLAVDEGTLSVDRPSRLRLSIVNRGSGDAHQVVAQVRSSHPRLHGLRFPFGLVRAGARKSRVREVTIAAREYESEITMVVVVSEADGFAPPNYVGRIGMAEVKRPLLILSCAVAGAEGGKPARLRAGQDFRVTCDVKNRGTETARNVEVDAELGAVRVERIAPRVDTSDQATLHLPLSVPLSAKEGDQLAIRIEGRDAAFGIHLETELPVVIARATVCRERLSRQEFEVRRSKLVDLRDQGALSKAEFEKFEAELVECLK